LLRPSPGLPGLSFEEGIFSQNPRRDVGRILQCRLMPSFPEALQVVTDLLLGDPNQGRNFPLLQAFEVQCGDALAPLQDGFPSVLHTKIPIDKNTADSSLRTLAVRRTT